MVSFQIPGLTMNSPNGDHMLIEQVPGDGRCPT